MFYRNLFFVITYYNVMFRNALTLVILMNHIPFYNTECVNNVGTVLFSTTDMSKTHWTTDEIGLLKARRYFQNMLPPPLKVGNLNENYVDMLFNYFREAFSAIKRETDDPNADRMMTTALSDSIGGYLKAWVLPVTKFAFYGGTISEQNLSTLFEFYDEIKRYLRTEGDGWHKPKSNLFDVSIKTTEPRVQTIVGSERTDPCDHFVFFEKTPEGLNVPIPHISWDGTSSKLFLPLKNHSIYAMSSKNSSSVLLKYYDAAKYCLRLRYPSMLKNFDVRFQSWLTNDVLPHLRDDNVYLALGSVLTVLNKPREVYDSVLYIHDKKPKLCKKMHAAAFSKKTLIVTLLIFLEVVWCCIALGYTCYAKRKKNKDSQVCCFVQPRPPDQHDKCYNTQEGSDRVPFGIKDSSAACKGSEAVQTDIERCFVKPPCSDTKGKTATKAPKKAAPCTGILVQDSLNLINTKARKKNTSKKNSTHSVKFSGVCPCDASTSHTVMPVSNSKTIVNTETDRRLKQNNDKQIDKKVKDVKIVNSQFNEKSHIAKETRKPKNRDAIAPILKRELMVTEARHSSANKESRAFNPKIYFDIPSAQTETPSIEQSNDTTESLQSEIIACAKEPQNTMLPIILSKNLNTDSGITNLERHQECQHFEEAKSSADSVNSKNTVKSVSLMMTESKTKTGTHLDLISDVPKVTFEVVKTETRIIEKPKYIEKKESEHLTSVLFRSVPEKHSPHDVEPQENIEIPRNDNTRNQEFITYPSQQKIGKDSKDSKSKSFVKTQTRVSTPIHSKKIVPFHEESTHSTSTTKNKKPVKADTDTPRRHSIQKEVKDTKHIKKPYWEIVIDEPQKDIYVDIRGTIEIDSRNAKRSRIPKLSVRTVERPAASNSPRVTRAGSQIPQLKKKAADDLVLKTSAERNKLNTSI